MTTLEQMLEQLAMEREQYKSTKEQYNKMIETPEILALYEAMMTHKRLLDQMEETVRATAIAQYHQDENKHPIDGVEIKIAKCYEYDDADALFWCERNASYAIRKVLDKNVFEDTVKTLSKNGIDLPPFVCYNETPKAQLGRDLSQYIKVQSTSGQIDDKNDIPF